MISDFDLLKQGTGWELCGSRWFGDDTEESDWDYFSIRSIEQERFLEQNGFEIKKNHYHDRNTHSIYVKGNVHAILIYNSRKRILAREIARELSKEDRKQVSAWNALYEAIKYFNK